MGIHKMLNRHCLNSTFQALHQLCVRYNTPRLNPLYDVGLYVHGRRKIFLVHAF